jgi:hypothetical protein
VLEIFQEAVNAVRVVRAVEAAVVNPNIKFSTWRFYNSKNPNTCLKCENYDGDEYELEDPDDLMSIFPWGEFVADDTFACNVHPNCGCFCVKISDQMNT